jgi:II/X family phage/plasmid replication protein
MIDTLELIVPFGVDFVQVVNGRHEFVDVDLKELDIPLGAKAVYWNDDGEQRTEALYSPYQSLETSFTGMACKVNLEGYFFPHVLIKCSPAKIMQGHNVFGTDCLEICVVEMLWFLEQAYPTLYSMLSVSTTEVARIDLTYMSKVASPKQVRQAIDFLARIQNGHTKPTKSKKYETTAYWGGATSRLIRQKCYSKYDEFMSQLEDYKKKAEKGDPHAKVVVTAMSDERIIEIARNSLRWECTFLKRYLERNQIPTNVWDLIKYQDKNPNLFPNMWQKGFSKIFEAIGGQTMKYVDDTQVLKKLKFNFQSVTAKGKISYRKAVNLYSFYTQIKTLGYQEIKNQALYSTSRFNELVADLVSVGFSKSYLQNLHVENDETKIIPFVQMINIDFSAQVPDWFVEPIPTPRKLAA